ncbi:hypothetical protein BDK51DRAFT_25677, partial [Blyttiomyces helicus]
MKSSLTTTTLFATLYAVLGVNACRTVTLSSQPNYIVNGGTYYFDLSLAADLVIDYGTTECSITVSPVLHLPSGSSLPCSTATAADNTVFNTTCPIQHSQMVAGVYTIDFNFADGTGTYRTFTVVNTEGHVANRSPSSLTQSECSSPATTTTTITPTYIGTFTPTTTLTDVITSTDIETTTLPPVTITSPAATFGTLVIHP